MIRLAPFFSVSLPAYALFVAGFAANCHFIHYPLEFGRSFAAILSPTGLLLGALLLAAPATWPLLLGTAGGIFLAYMSLVRGHELTAPAVVLALTLGQVATTAWLVRRWCGPGLAFERVRDSAVLLVVTVSVNLVVSAAAGAFLHQYQAEDFSVFFRTRWVSHTLAVVVVTPLLVVLGRQPWRRLRPPPARIAEALVLAAATVVIVAYGLGRIGRPLNATPTPLLALLPLMVAAVRFGVGGACVASLIVAAQAIHAVGQGGPWPATGDILARLAEAELFVGIVAVTGIVLGAGLSQMRAVERGLRESENRFRALFDTRPDAICVLRDGGVTLANPAFLQLFGTDLARLRDRPLGALLPPAESERLAGYFRDAGADRNATLETVGLRADATEFPLELRTGQFDLGADSYRIVVCHDLTERRRATRELNHINRALRAISRCNQVLVHVQTESALLESICRVLVDEAGYVLAWVGFAETTPGKNVRIAAHAGPASDYVDGLVVSWADDEFGRGPTGTAIRTGRPSVAQDFAKDPRLEPWRQRALRHGIGSSIVFPLRTDGTVIGCLCIYSGSTETFDGREIDLLRELADDLSFGLQSLRIRAEHARAEAEVRRLLEQRRAAEEALRRSEERYRAAMHHSAVGMALVGLDGRWLEVNAALSNIVGYSVEELLRMQFSDITVPDDNGPDLRAMAEAVAGRTPSFELEKRYRHKDGRTIWVHIHGALRRDDNGRPLHFIAQTLDITPRRVAEASLAETTERLALALHASGLGIWRHRFAPRATDWDARMFALFGRPVAPAAPVLGEILAQVLDEDRAAVESAWGDSPGERRALHLRFRIVRPDGATRHLELQGTVHRDALGRPDWATGVAGDITETVEAAAESERLRVQLQQAQRMEALGNLAAGVAHDFNNLLTGINGFVELASTTLAPSHEAAQLLQQARHGALSARDLVRRILSFSRGGQGAKRVVVDLAAVVRDTAPLIAATLPANVSLSLNAGPSPAPCLADVGQLQQVLMNLSTNGAHAIGDRPGTLRIAIAHCRLAAGTPPLAADATGGAFVRLSVHDNGCGMDEATQRRIFERFFTTKKLGEGTGLGLPIVREIVTAHGGVLDVDSAPGQGSVFSIFLPLALPESRGVPAVPVPLAPVGSGQRVLIVDDEPAVGKVALLTLERHGYRPELHTDPESALRSFLAAPSEFDLVITDHNMPRISGSDLIGRLRAVRPGLPAVLMSGRFSPLPSPESNADGSSARLKKPFELDELLAAVATVLGPAG